MSSPSVIFELIKFINVFTQSLIITKIYVGEFYEKFYQTSKQEMQENSILLERSLI